MSLEKSTEFVCLICGEFTPASKNHREPVYVEGEKICGTVCSSCLYKNSSYMDKDLHPDYFHCADCGDVSKGNKCLGECEYCKAKRD